MKNTKVVCTLGPASDEKPVLAKMVKAGMNVVRLNFSHGTYDHFEKIIANVRAVSKELNTPIAIIQDLQGPKIRTAKLPPEGIKVQRGQRIVLTVRNATAEKDLIPVQYKHDRILIDDGLIELKVVTKTKAEKSKTYTDLTCRVINAGTIFSHKGINVPGGTINAPSLSEKDKKDLSFGLKHKVDYIALSFVK